MFEDILDYDRVFIDVKCCECGKPSKFDFTEFKKLKDKYDIETVITWTCLDCSDRKEYV